MQIDIGPLEEQARALEEQFAALPVVLKLEVVSDGTYAAARQLVPVVKGAAPLDEGDLRDSIRAVRSTARYAADPGNPYGRLLSSKRARTGAAAVLIGGKGARHAVLVHYGTIRKPPNAFFQHTIEANKNVAGEAMRKAFARRLRSIAKQMETGRLSKRLQTLAAGG